MRLLPLILLPALVSCTAAKAPVEVPAAPPAAVDVVQETPVEEVVELSADEQALAEVKGAAMKLGGTLKGALGPAMAEGGPTQAVGVCSEQASALTAQVREETGVQVGRSSLRLRNPDNQGPEWVASWLAETGERSAEGLKPVLEIADTPEGRVARFLKPLPVEGLCVTCHGAALTPEVTALLAEKYPEDQATGYAVGELRGVIWAEKALD